MNLKTIIAKVVSWFKGEASAAEQQFEARLNVIDGLIHSHVAALLNSDNALSARIATIEETMSTPATAATPAAQATPANQVNTAVQIALALKAIDASLSVDAVQGATNAALAALYPAP
ncbi:hypothetical protein [Caballeronia sp. DA-9]|uniref:hypothetical protein n=1 Tax=Caballeronia sp. DA-9 TaxID=3436237 RepID=UPI003F66C784